MKTERQTDQTAKVEENEADDRLRKQISDIIIYLQFQKGNCRQITQICKRIIDPDKIRKKTKMFDLQN